MCVCKHLNQRARRIGKSIIKSFRSVFKKKKRKKKHMTRLSFITQFNIEFLLPFTGCTGSGWKNASYICVCI